MLLIVFLFISVLFIVVSTSKLHLHPFLALLFAAVGFGLCARMPLSEIVKSINSGFGGTLGSIGIVIIAGVIIGTFLERSGGAYAVAERILKIIGKRKRNFSSKKELFCCKSSRARKRYSGFRDRGYTLPWNRDQV